MIVDNLSWSLDLTEGTEVRGSVPEDPILLLQEQFILSE